MGVVPPFTGVAVNVTGVPAQMLFCEAAILTDAVRLGLTVIVMLLLVTIAGAAHMALLVIVQVTLSPLTSVLLVKVGLLVPAFMPLTCHWYVGVEPGLVGIAVNVTGVPAQILFSDAAMVTVGVMLLSTATCTLAKSIHPSALVIVTV